MLLHKVLCNISHLLILYLLLLLNGTVALTALLEGHGGQCWATVRKRSLVMYIGSWTNWEITQGAEGSDLLTPRGRWETIMSV